MAKRFTETEKWKDGWFLKLPAYCKLAWIYLCDQCDHAGIIEVVEPLANFQIGAEIDWPDFIAKAGDRIIDLGEGKLWVKAFCDFQYGTLNPENKVHKSVLNRLEKMGLTSPSQAPCKGAKDKDKEKEKETDTEKEKETRGECEGGTWIVPEHVDSPRVRELLVDFERMRRRIRKPIKDVANTSRLLKKFDDAEHLEYALEMCIGNEYQGLKTDYRPANSKRGPVTFAEQRESNTRSAKEAFVNAGK